MRWTPSTRVTTSFSNGLVPTHRQINGLYRRIRVVVTHRVMNVATDFSCVACNAISTNLEEPRHRWPTPLRPPNEVVVAKYSWLGGVKVPGFVRFFLYVLVVHRAGFGRRCDSGISLPLHDRPIIRTVQYTYVLFHNQYTKNLNHPTQVWLECRGKIARVEGARVISSPMLGCRVGRLALIPAL